MTWECQLIRVSGMVSLGREFCLQFLEENELSIPDNYEILDAIENHEINKMLTLPGKIQFCHCFRLPMTSMHLVI